MKYNRGVFDVLPPSPSGGQDDLAHKQTPRKFSRRIRPNRQPVPPAPPGAGAPRQPVISLQWKLPSRLRKPIRQQLQQERQRRRAQQSIIHFERRPLVTQKIDGDRVQKNTGAEHHTGDVYRNTRAKVRVALPPYLGGFSRQFTGTQKKFSKNLPAARPVPKPVRKIVPASISFQRRQVPTQVQVLVQQFPLAADRDVPYAWQPPAVAVLQTAERLPEHNAQVQLAERAREIEQPKRRFALPFSLSFWPSSLLSSKKKFHAGPSRVAARFKVPPSLVANILVLGVGLLGVMGLVWSLQGAGRGTAVLSSVEDKSRGAYEKLMAAQAAFATTDFSGGQEQLSQAGELLGSARADLTKALAATQQVLRVLDVSGTVRSGDELLLAGESLTEAGAHIARGASAFFDVEIFADEGVPKVKPHTLVDALQVARDEFVAALPKLDIAQRALGKVESPFLPSEVASQAATLKTAIPNVTKFLQGFVDQSETLMELLGAKESRQYLVLFANDDELRPIGGFVGSIGLVHVNRGQVENVDVDTVYDPDGQLKEFIAPPDPLLPVTNRWYMRDANWFVDYEQSAKKIADFFEKEGGPTVDGVILLTPNVIEQLLKITGPLPVPGYDVVLTADNFQQITQDQVTYSYDRVANRPKQFLADVTPLLLNRLFSKGEDEDTHSYGAVMKALSDAARSKDLLLYFRSEEVQSHVREAGWAGAVPQNVPGLLYVNNANIGGHKSDKFIDQEIDYRVEVGERGKPTAIVTIRRTHHGPDEPDGYNYPQYEDPHVKDNIVFQRVLVPLNSQLLEAKGYASAADIPRPKLPHEGVVTTADAEVAGWQSSISQHASGTLIGKEAGYTFFANWIITKPGQTTVTLYRYELPEVVALPQLLSPAAHYAMTVIKQPGSQRTNVRASLKLPASVSIVHAVPPSGITQETPHELVWRGALKSDVSIGGVFEAR